MLKIARVKTRVISVCSGILFAVIGGFAAGVAENANAQEAMARVFMQASGNGPTSSFFTAAPLNVPLTTFVSARVDASGAANAASYFCDADATFANDLPVFSVGGVVMPGDLLNVCLDGATPDLTVRIYLDGANVYQMAVGDDSPTVASSASGDEFFMLSDGTTVTALAAGVIGLEPSNCAAIGMQDAAGFGKCEPIPPNCDSASAELTGGVCVCKDGFDELDDAQDPQICIPDETDDEMPEEPGDETNAESGGGDNTSGGGADTGGGSSAKKGFVFGAIGLFFAVHFLQGDAENFSYSPAFGYSVNESGYSANVGGRVDFVNDEWRLFWTAGQTNANGDWDNFRYSSGGEYKTDFWQASFSESVQGKTADYDFALLADLQGGIWSLSPVYRLHSRLEEGETETRNSLNLEGILRYEDWRITPSAGFGWQRTEEFADGGKFRLDVVREF